MVGGFGVPDERTLLGGCVTFCKETGLAFCLVPTESCIPGWHWVTKKRERATADRGPASGGGGRGSRDRIVSWIHYWKDTIFVYPSFLPMKPLQLLGFPHLSSKCVQHMKPISQQANNGNIPPGDNLIPLLLTIATARTQPINSLPLTTHLGVKTPFVSCKPARERKIHSISPQHGPLDMQTHRQTVRRHGIGNLAPPFNTSNLKPHHVGSADDSEGVFRGRRGAPRARVRGLPTYNETEMGASVEPTCLGRLSRRGSDTGLCSRGR